MPDLLGLLVLVLWAALMLGWVLPRERRAAAAREELLGLVHRFLGEG